MIETGRATTIALVMVEFKILDPPNALKGYVECFRVSAFGLDDFMSIKVCPTGHPEIVFQHRFGKSAIENIRVESGRVVTPPLLFVHGQVTEVAVMNFRGPYSTVQVVLRPTALQSLLGLDAAELANRSMTPEGLISDPDSARRLERRLIDAGSDQERVDLLSAFVGEMGRTGHPADDLIEEGIHLIERHIATITVKVLLQRIGLSERRFERRFLRAVGVPPQFYIRVRRINEAFRLMDTGRYDRLSDVAYALNFYDQSHFIREVRAFSGITPRSISQKVNEFHSDVVASSYLDPHDG